MPNKEIKPNSKLVDNDDDGDNDNNKPKVDFDVEAILDRKVVNYKRCI